jgi:hypothetical protein
MNLKDVYPVDSLERKFDKSVFIDYYGMDDIDEIAKLEPGCMLELGASAWMHYIESGAKVNPQKLSKYFDAQDPLIFRQVEKVMKRKVLQDIVLIHAHVDDNTLVRDICGQLLLSRTYPNNLHISDVEFSNPYEPVVESDQEYSFHNYRSLGLFSELLENIVDLGKSNNISKITLSAASNDQIPYFEKHGFKVEDTDFSKQAIELDSGIPMERKCT